MRWAKMSRYLKENTDWTPVIFTPSNAGYIINDKSLNNPVIDGLEIIKHPIIEPNNFLSYLGLNSLKKNIAAGGVGASKDGKLGFKNRLILWVRSNLFVPDARFLWISPSSRRIIKEIKKHKIDAIISTGPPHTVHLIANRVKKATNIKWIADFRDPWTGIDFFDDLNLSDFARKKHFKQEAEVIKNADGLVTISKFLAEDFYELGGKKFDVITNGFDPADFSEKAPYSPNNQFVISHIGSLNKDRNLPEFWQAIKLLCDKNEKFKDLIKIRLIGSLTPELEDDLRELGILERVELIDQIPHSKAIEYAMQSEMLLLLINNTPKQKGIMPGKFFEYLATGRPILCIGNTAGNVADAIKETESGVTIGFGKPDKIVEHLEENFELYLTNQLSLDSSNTINKFSRKELAQQYARLLDKICHD